VILGVVGDSAAGKTTITRGIVRMLGEDMVTHIAADDYHRFDRKQRAERAITPLDPDCNYMDIMEQHFREVRAGRSILKPVYNHKDGTFGPPVYVTPHKFVVIEGLLGYHTEALRDLYDVRIFLAPAEELRRQWKVDRDCSRRGYTTNQVLEELDRREPDSEMYIRPQRHYADVTISFSAPAHADQEHLDATLTLGAGVRHPDLAPHLDGSQPGLSLSERDGDQQLRISGAIDPAYAAKIEEVIWDRLHFASHLRSERLGEFTVGTQLHRSESLALVQLIVLYHFATARASIALGGTGPRVDRPAKAPAAEAGVS
jgi:phosphoribulokinase